MRVTAESKETFCYYSYPGFGETDCPTFFVNERDHSGDSSIHSHAFFPVGKTCNALGLPDRHAVSGVNFVAN